MVKVLFQFSEVFINQIFFAPLIHYVYDLILSIKKYNIFQAKRNIFKSFFYDQSCFFPGYILYKVAQRRLITEMLFQFPVLYNSFLQLVLANWFQQVINPVVLE